jgi:hypothetical protein
MKSGFASGNNGVRYGQNGTLLDVFELACVEVPPVAARVDKDPSMVWLS